MTATVASGPAAELAELASLSARLGADRTLIQGAGGNTSIKLGDALWVKASGTWLSAAQQQPIFVGLALSEVRRRMDAGEAEPAIPALLDKTDSQRPSIETTLHALLPHRVVLHVHSVNAIAFAVRSNGPELARERLDGLRWAWVPYARPGLPLTRAVRDVLPQRPDVLLLANHGLIVGGQDETSAAALLQDVERRLSCPQRSPGVADMATLRALVEGSAGRYRVAAIASAHGAATDALSRILAGKGTLYPDHVVFLGAGPVRVSSLAEAGELLRTETTAALVLVAGIGALIRNDLGAGADEMAACLGLVLARLEEGAPVVYLQPHEEAELCNWDAEKFRQTLQRAQS